MLFQHLQDWLNVVNFVREVTNDNLAKKKSVNKESMIQLVENFLSGASRYFLTPLIFNKSYILYENNITF